MGDWGLRVGSMGLLLAFQTAMPLLTRYSRVRRTKEMFLPTVAVASNELLKLLICLTVLLFLEGSPRRLLDSLFHHLVKEPVETFKVCIPSLIFILQNNLYFVALSNLEPSTYLVRNDKATLETVYGMLGDTPALSSHCFLKLHFRR